jgi:hypothetical protein
MQENGFNRLLLLLLRAQLPVPSNNKQWQSQPVGTVRTSRGSAIVGLGR